MNHNNLERYSFLWSEVRLIIAALALFLGGVSPLLKLGLPSALAPAPPSIPRRPLAALETRPPFGAGLFASAALLDYLGGRGGVSPLPLEQNQAPLGRQRQVGCGGLLRDGGLRIKFGARGTARQK